MPKKITTAEVIERLKLIHGDKYDFSKVVYTKMKSKVCIICPKHGEIYMNPDDLLRGRGCRYCAGKQRGSNEEFIKKAHSKHGDKYLYDKVNYVNNCSEVEIICKVHGPFMQKPSTHLIGCGCPMCGKQNSIKKRTVSLTNFISKAQQIYGDKYDYSKVEYVNAKTKVNILCRKHGIFRMTPDSHLQNHGCPKCNRSKLEQEISLFLTDNGIKFIEQYNCSWLGLQTLDFYLPEHNIGIECQGKQHFMDGCTFGGNETLDMIINRDKCKLTKCNENQITLLYYSNLGIDYPYQVFEDKEVLLKEILKHNKNDFRNAKKFI